MTEPEPRAVPVGAGPEAERRPEPEPESLAAGDFTAVRGKLEATLFEIKRVIVGQERMLERVLVALLSGGHVLIEGVPGLAKTLTVKTLADVLGGTFRRIQFTPDLVPSDLVGTRIYRAGDGFDTELGPVFCNFLLADEINRAPAKVQSALLEVMQEHQVTIGGETYRVPEPFLVLATQNPIEAEGTYPLPEAQVDRFMLKVLVDYPDFTDELAVVQRSLGGKPPLHAVVSVDELAAMQRTAERRLRRSARLDLRRLLDPRDAPARRARPDRPLPLRGLRSEPARLDLARARRPGSRLDPRAHVRAPAGRARPRQGRAPAPAGAHVRGARRGRDAGHPARRRSRSGAAAPDRPRTGGCVTLAPPRTAARPGPGPMPEELLRTLELTLRGRIDGLLAGEHRSTTLGPGTELAQIRPYVPGRRRPPHRLERHGAHR